eukprot:gnl/TRDRNA2_/TRDRNA2_185503_c0_seq1.p1 gnl/TRDRNA2_/TRDRNA2_185503_c0~~gnl/TRDRNA2_/TRDRNA2_185503_c0_seq1.p1  ORF type:complete len:552 (+),score=122.92 gnl/TRDRNA2_/TRDRNA2_185503_c0_seq1:96-1751(+)
MRRSFLQNYQAARHERLLQASKASKENAAQQAKSGPPDASFADYNYTQIAMRELQSDLDEDRDARRAVPNIPRAKMGLLKLPYEPPRGKGPPDFLEWVESEWFHGISALVIGTNAIIIGLETDIQAKQWWYIEQGLLVFFTFELVMRMWKHGKAFFFNEDDWVWNLFDFSIVVCGIGDQWLVPAAKKVLHKNDKQGGGAVFTIVRLFRLLRIVRLFRLVKIVRPLYELAQGVIEALHGMLWVMVFMALSLYAFAILSTRLIGHADMLPEEIRDEPDIIHIQIMFGTVGSSMFALFGTMSSWSLMKFEPLFQESQSLRPVFVMIYVFSAWALLAVMTGVVSENMISIREQLAREDEQKEERRQAVVTDLLVELFRAADADGSGAVSREEFMAMLRTPDLGKKLMKNTNVRVTDLQELFDWLDHDEGGTITIDEFMDGFRWINEPLRAKSLVKLQERLLRDLKLFEDTVVDCLHDHHSQLARVIAQPLRKVHAITEQMQNLDGHLREMRVGLKSGSADQPTEEELQKVERRLNAKIAKVVRTLDEMERFEEGY